MTKMSHPTNSGQEPQTLSPALARERVAESLKKRHRNEGRFLSYGRIAISTALLFLVILFGSILTKGIPGFFQYYVTFDVYLSADELDPYGDASAQSLFDGNARSVLRDGFFELLDVSGRKNKKAAGKILSQGAEQRLRQMVVDDPSLLNTTQTITVAVDDDIDSFLRGFISRDTPEDDRRINDTTIGYVDSLEEMGRIHYLVSDYLFFGSASRNPEMAGIKGAFFGSILTLSICLLLAFPLGVGTAIYLEEFAPKNKITEFIEVNINNLAAVPSVVFGILGLAVFIGIFGLPRSIPLTGGVVLALMTMPTIIISSRAAIRAVPPSIRDAAYGVGASKVQTVFHHTLPLAMPGMLTGTIIGMAQALGETAPLLMIGMVAFVVDIPGGVTDPATVLPVQIFMWADFAERMFVQKTSAAIIILLSFLLVMNAAAIIIRKKLERRW